LNSAPVFDAVEQGIQALGHQVVDQHEDVAVIWSVLWAGRMKGNQLVYQQCIQQNKPVVIVEVGNLKRGTTWRLSINHVNGLGQFGNDHTLDRARPEKLQVALKPVPQDARGEILIACQHYESLQWQGMPTMSQWCHDTIAKIKQYSTRRIIVRSHPRSPFTFKVPNIMVEKPNRVATTYDEFDIFYNYHCVINHNSGPAVQAAIQGTPVLCDASSLAAPLSIKWENLETPTIPDRSEWFLKLCHTEWTVEEIRNGIPMARLFP
jgi:hypothetical protein